MRPFRFGVSARGLGGPGEWTALARRVEALGYDTFSVADHLVEGLLPPLVALAHAAEATERIRLGTLVLNNDLRHPAMTAREAAALDVLSGGRVELGLGAGHSRPEYEQVGLPFDDAAVRVARLEESATVIAGSSEASPSPSRGRTISSVTTHSGRRPSSGSCRS